ncbi:MULTISPECIES: ABC transporter ATP-binding protein [unclassified Mesorhizobium]|uniref:ABC transporter ATP-binding protein n=1 Tax=unclassified Mesorhizobium TaxID=325217 RepID=UPI0006F76009|nr:MULTISPECIES: ABC transporter ATP-binding protein [unclassified Mesorhizobium]KQZ13369.1 ABC transporter ATP-binding protein [Mesorhizobium sp. Root1471]KQZ35882.1 ABC transporter ATP-binding protein [Mesorhizobium sp. Root554]MDR7032209.1 branched-chain amino acid transport system ATP-binding protein [Mesorhizobium sp. BE184]
MLEIRDLHVAYGGVSALNGISLTVNSGDFVSIVGPNGAGKTTLFKSISGSVPVRSGAITFEGRDLNAVPAHERPHLGIAHVPEGRQVFPNLTVEENLEMGAYTEAGQKHWKDNLDYVLKLFPILGERRLQQAGTLSGGQQQMVAIARGLASSPKLLMLDEPSMGLAPAVADSIFEAIVEIRKARNLTVLLVEQRAVEALESCDRGYVIETGRVVLEGAQTELLSDDRVRKAYLGI